MSSHPAPTRALPDKPSLDQLRKQAKDLLKAYRAGKKDAIAEVERFEANPGASHFTLGDAQRVLARAYGFASWAKLRKHVEGVNVAALCLAVEAGDVALVRKLAKAGPALVNTQRGGSFGERTALHFAVLARDANMTRALMELDADARSGIWPHRDATTAHTLAVERGYDEIVAIIEQEEERRRRQASPSGATIGSQTEAILKAIATGRCEEAIRHLESDLSLVGACDVRGATPLHFAAVMQNVDLVAWLLDHGAAVDAQAAFDVPQGAYPATKVSGKTPLDYAALVAGWSAHSRDFSFLENSRLEPARFDETVRLLRSKGAELTPRGAVAIGDAPAVRQMHRDGRLDNEIHTFRGGLLSIAVRVNRLDMVSLLLDLGLDPDEAMTTAEGDRSWGMPLWFAAMCGRQEIAELLLARGADVDAIVYACGDALSVANRTEDDTMKALLLQHGARLTVEGVSDPETAKAILEGRLAAQSLNVIEPSATDLAEQMLWAAGGRNAEIVRLCLPHVPRKRDDPWWNYVLMHATLPASFRLVLDHGIDPDVIGNGGYTILHHLATRHVEEQTRLVRATMLLDAGASLDKRDPLLKSTPLGWACRWGRVDLVELYLTRGADAEEADAEAWATPLAWATKGGHREIVDMLRFHGLERT